MIWNELGLRRKLIDNKRTASGAFGVLEHIYQAKLVAPLLFLMLFWLWETFRPFRQSHQPRLKHAARNIGIALLNTIVLAFLVGLATVSVAAWAEQAGFGLLRIVDLGTSATLGLTLLILDGWMYAWHRANHVVPLLWRFHRMHHSDTAMDVTTATRFHLGEHVIGGTLRLAVIALFGMQIWNVVLYELLVIVATQFHHANISLGRFDRYLRWFIVTPDMHRIHHSRLREETNSNYATILSIWDRIAASFRMRNDGSAIECGLDEFRATRWQTIRGMLWTPFVSDDETMQSHD